MIDEIIRKAAAQYGVGNVEYASLGEGPIHRTYKVSFPDQQEIVLQCINQNTFPQPENIIHNYREIYEYLQSLTGERTFIPALLRTIHGRYFWVDDTGNFWRATEFVPNSYSVVNAKNETQAALAAKGFGNFIRMLSGLDPERLNIIIKGFHDPVLRYAQFEESVSNGTIKRLLKATHLIAEVRQRYSLVSFYEMIINNAAFKVRVMHHDSKISNILFDKTTDTPVCPVDLDTTMPGYYFSDLGDLIRSTACTVAEDSTKWEEIGVKKSVYRAVVEGYLSGVGSNFTPDELQYIHHSGLLLTYLQTIRFLADYLNHDVYYKTTHPEQNLNRALNQFIFLERLEEFLATEYNYKF